MLPMPRLRLLIVALLLPVAFGLRGQPLPANGSCAGAQALCAGQPLPGHNEGVLNDPDSVPDHCQPWSKFVWYTFRTNGAGGPVTVSLGGLQCNGAIPGMGNAMGVLVLQGDGSCDPAQFQPVSACASDSLPFAVTTDQPLLPDTRYWVVAGGVRNDGATISAECHFNISVDGPGADVTGVDFSAGPDVVIPEGGSTQLHATGGTTYTWTPNSGLSGDQVPDPVAQPNETTAYAVSTDLHGCTYTDTVVVEVVRLVNPVNTFSPNGDGINDVWEVPELMNYPQADVSIYDRWGQRVYHSIGYKEPFDGAGLPTATYYWYIQVNDVKGRSDPYTGYVTLVR